MTAVSLEDNVRSGRMHFRVIRERMEMKTSVLLLKIQGERLCHGKILSVFAGKRENAGGEPRVFTLDGAFLCGLIARHLEREENL